MVDLIAFWLIIMLSVSVVFMIIDWVVEASMRKRTRRRPRKNLASPRLKKVVFPQGDEFEEVMEIVNGKRDL